MNQLLEYLRERLEEAIEDAVREGYDYATVYHETARGSIELSTTAGDSQEVIICTQRNEDGRFPNLTEALMGIFPSWYEIEQRTRERYHIYDEDDFPTCYRKDPYYHYA